MWKNPVYLYLLILGCLVVLYKGCDSEAGTNPFALSTIDEIIAIEGSRSELASSMPENSFLKYYPASSDQWRILSLSNLIQNLKLNQAGDSIVSPLEQLGWIEGYVIDRENSDLLLFGREMPSWPVLYLDELLQLDELLLTGSSHPFCSLDPLPGNVLAFNEAINQKEGAINNQAYYNNLQAVWGPQVVKVGGVTRKSSIALTMLDADYHMKKVSQGHVRVEPIQSLMDMRLERSASDTEVTDQKPSSSRFWFNCKSGDPIFQVAEDITMLESCDVVLLTEAQASSSSGELYDSGEEDPLANHWASSFSREFKTIATQVEVYAQMENLYRLYALMMALEYNNHLSYANNFFSSLAEVNPLQRVYDIPDSYPGLVNLKFDTTFTDNQSYSISTVFVCGGVSMEMSLSNENVLPSSNLTYHADYVKQSRPNSTASSWIMSLPAEFGKGRIYSGRSISEIKPAKLDPIPAYRKPSK